MHKLYSRYFALEGLDGSGKSTLIQEIKKEIDTYSNGDIKVEILVSPSSLCREEIRELKLSNPNYTNKDLAKIYIKDLIKLSKYIKNNPDTLFIADRSIYSTFAYQLDDMSSNELEAIRKELKKAHYKTKDLLYPGSIILCDLTWTKYLEINDKRYGEEKSHFTFKEFHTISDRYKEYFDRKKTLNLLDHSFIVDVHNQILVAKPKIKDYPSKPKDWSLAKYLAVSILALMNNEPILNPLTLNNTTR